VAVAAGKLTALATRRMGRGGTSLPGLVAERIDPQLLRHICRQLGYGSVVVTGTNGKTTTSRMLAAAAAAAGFHVLHNRSGSNLMRGLTTTAVAGAGVGGTLSNANGRLGVFEVDEATLPQAVTALQPRAVIFTNLFRDQLDRYGEVDSIAAIWRRALERLDNSSTIVLNADDPSVASLAEVWSGQVLGFGVDDVSHAAETEHAADSRWCPACGSEYLYTALYFGHIGLWSCPGCNRRRIPPAVSATQVKLEPSGVSRAKFSTPQGRVSLDLPLGGLYNVYNALAAMAGALAAQLPLAAVTTALEGTDAAFGRQERMVVRGRDVHMLLCKNPAGANQILRLLAAESGAQHLLILLNDDVADGRDISWIWDVDYESLAGTVDSVVVSGRRADDMALRLKYAGLEHMLVVEPNPRLAVERALTLVPEGCRLFVLPTYTAMLTVREHLAGLAGRSHFWEG